MTYYPSSAEIDRLAKEVFDKAEVLRRKMFFGQATGKEMERWNVLDNVLLTISNPRVPDEMKLKLLRMALADELAVK